MGKFEIRRSNAGIRFNLKAGNGEIVGTSEVYKSRSSCLKGINSVIRNAAAAALEDQTVEGFKAEKCPKFEIYIDKAGETRFRLKATNGQIILASEGYKAKDSCLNGVESVRKNAAEGNISEAE